MRLAAIYIPSGVLPFIFGKEHEGYTINLGGKYIYELSENSNFAQIIKRTVNENFINDFWGHGIHSISAIVGKNGTGKTSLLNIFRFRSFCSYVVENDQGEKPKILGDSLNSFDIIYYSPFLNIQNFDYEHGNFYDMSKYSTMLNDTGFENLDLSSLMQLHRSENIKRWIKFRQRKDIDFYLKNVGLPVFNFIKIKLNQIEVTNNDTSYDFRPFFVKFKEISNSERDKRYLDLEKIKGKPISSEERRNFSNRNNLELYITETIIKKVHKILESSGNKYLQEGVIKSNFSVDSQEFLKNENLKDSFYWFLDNAYIKFKKNEKFITLPVLEIKQLLELLLSELPEDEEIDNWSEYEIKLETASQIINAYENFIRAFQDDFTYDKTIPLIFSPDISLSSGEKGMYDMFASLNEIQYRLTNNIKEVSHLFNKNGDNLENCLILLDEPEMGFHPQWKKKFISSILSIFPLIFKQKKLQIIFTTHDPLTLSDIPQNNVVYFDKSADNHTIIHNEKLKTFGANVHDLLAQSFFLEDGFMGEFVKTKIQDVLNILNYEILQQELNKLKQEKSKNYTALIETKTKALIHLKTSLIDKDANYCKSIIDIVDEPILKFKMEEMLIIAFPNLIDKNDAILKAKQILGKAGLGLSDLINDSDIS